MSLRERLFGKPQETQNRARPVLVPGRTTSDTSFMTTMLGSEMKRPILREKNIAERLRIIRDIAPDASMAVWNVIRLGISDWELQVVSGEDDAGREIIDIPNTKRLNEWVKDNIAREYGKGLAAFMQTATLTVMTEGAVAAEVEVSSSLKDIVDWHLVMPSKVHTRKTASEEATKEKPEGTLIYCWRDRKIGEMVDLSDTQFRYIPLDAEINDPFGRSPILPALVQVEFQMSLICDLRAVVHNQGYPRIDVSVLEEAIVASAPAKLQQYGNEDQLASFVENKIKELASAYAQLEPDDAFVHLDNVTISNWFPGTSLDFGKVESIITSQIVTSLKQLPILLGRNEGTTETHGTVQYRIYVKGVESIREKVSELAEFCGNLTLRVWGVPGTCKVSFEEIRHTDRQKEALASLQEHQAIQIAITTGMIDKDEAAEILYGHKATGEAQQPSQQVVVMPGTPGTPGTPTGIPEANPPAPETPPQETPPPSTEPGQNYLPLDFGESATEKKYRGNLQVYEICSTLGDDGGTEAVGLAVFADGQALISAQEKIPNTLIVDYEFTSLDDVLERDGKFIKETDEKVRSFTELYGIAADKFGWDSEDEKRWVEMPARSEIGIEKAGVALRKPKGFIRAKGS